MRRHRLDGIQQQIDKRLFQLKIVTLQLIRILRINAFQLDGLVLKLALKHQ